MSKTPIIIGVIILVLLIIASLFFLLPSLLHNHVIESTTTTTITPTSTAVPPSSSSTTSVTPTTTTTIPSPKVKLLQLNVNNVIVDPEDALIYANQLMKNATYNYTFVNELEQGEFVIVNISIGDISNQNVTLYYSNFSVITSNGTYGSVIVPTTAFHDLNEAGISLIPLFQSSSSSVKLRPSYGVGWRQLIFVVPKGSIIEGIKVVERGVSVGTTAISSSTVHYLSIIKLNLMSNDSRVSILYNSSNNTIYTISNVLNIKGYIVNYHYTATVALTAVNVSPSFQFTISKGLIGKELPLATQGPSSIPFSLTINLPAESYEGDINVSFYFTYIPSWSVKVDAFINDTAEAIYYGNSGYSYFVYNVSISFVNPFYTRAEIEGQDFALITSAGTFNSTFVNNTYLRTVTNDLFNSSILNHTTLSYQLVFLVPVKAKPYYLVFRSQNGIVMDKVPVENIKPIYFSLITKVVMLSNNTNISVISQNISIIGVYSGQRFNLSGIIAYDIFNFYIRNYSMVGVSVSQPFKLVGIYPSSIIGYVTHFSNIRFQVGVMAPNESYYGNLTLMFYFVINVPPQQSSTNSAAMPYIPALSMAIIPLALVEKRKLGKQHNKLT